MATRRERYGYRRTQDLRMSVQFTGCRPKFSKPDFLGDALIAKVTGMRIYSRYASGLSVGRLVFEWKAE
jgi:hypothetical protein